VSFREAVLRRHASRISKLIVDSFRVLVRKEALIDDVRINTTTLCVQLFDKRGNSIPPERLSAGERQLLATALLWGLGRAAGRPLPVIIDTPLGRLDGTHRRRLLTNYIPNASHQVIVLATDEEISDEEISMLEPSIARKHLLQYADSTMCTTVRQLEEQELRDVS
jgi:DNA sulfur modification protein DndD